MRDVELYRHLLGLEAPWTVRAVELNVQGQRVDGWAGYAEDVRATLKFNQASAGNGGVGRGSTRPWVCLQITGCSIDSCLKARPV